MGEKHETHDTARMIIDRLDEKGPATQHQLSEELNVHRNSINRNVRGFLLKRLGIVEQLDNHKYGLKWHIPEEDNVKLHYHRMKRKLRRNPTPEEMAGLIKEAPGDARRLLFKYIPFYREPDRNEISAAASEIWDMIVWGGLHSEFETKKGLFQKGVAEVVVFGIDQGTFDRIMNGKPTVELDEARRYLEDFPEMGPKITSEKKGSARISYKVEWTDDAKNILHPLLHSDHFWIKKSTIQLPRRLEVKLYRRYKKFFGRDDDYLLMRIGEMAKGRVPSQEAIADIFTWIESSERRDRALEVLRDFCKNGLEVGHLDEETKRKIVNSLLDTFFSATSDDGLCEPAMEIIEMLDVRDGAVIAKSMELVLSSLREGLTGMRYEKLGRWLISDHSLREDLIVGVEKIMRETEDDRLIKKCRIFIASVEREGYSVAIG